MKRCAGCNELTINNYACEFCWMEAFKVLDIKDLSTETYKIISFLKTKKKRRNAIKIWLR